MMLHAKLVTHTSALEAIEDEWWTLWRETPNATPFQSPAWLIAWWRAFAPGQLATLAMYDDGRLAALAPFFLEDGQYGRRLLPLGLGTTDYLDILISPRAEPAARRIAEAYSELQWDSWELEELPAWASARQLKSPACCEETWAGQSACPMLAFDRDAMSAVPPLQRRKLRMTRHRMARRGISVRPIDCSNSAGFCADLIRLHGARRREQNESGVLVDEAVQRFHAEAMPSLARAGLLHAFAADCDGRTIGAYYGLRERRRAYAYLGGFDPEFAHESPGTALIGHAIESAHAGGAREFHLLRGREPYKYAWGAYDTWTLKRSLRRRT